MKKSTRSILQELSSISVKRNTTLLIENRGENIIQSAINLLELIQENYSSEIANDLERRFILSIRHKKLDRFKRGMSHLKKNPTSDFLIPNINNNTDS